MNDPCVKPFIEGFVVKKVNTILMNTQIDVHVTFVGPEEMITQGRLREHS